MQFDSITILGLAAAIVTTSGFFPQVIKTWRTRKTRDISLAMYLVLCFGICLWLAYGFLRGDLPLLVANGVTLLCVITILALKFKHK
ncbi:MAG: hypothetical protein CMM48_12720 [Rhodospirillaceae bacterium]|nr:hypothetical protein [Rhodospirillaceae bacterium]